MQEKGFALSWKCLNTFPKSQKNMFLKGDFKLEADKLLSLKQAFEKMRNKWSKELASKFQQPKKSHFQISGGNVTFCFVLPKTVKLIQKKFPYLPICLRSIEGGPGGALDMGVDITFTALKASSKGSVIFEKEPKDFKDFQVSRKMYEDKSYLCAASDIVRKSNKNEVLNKLNILLGRLHSLEEKNEEDQFYAFKPQKREDEEPKIISDQFFMSYLFMLHSAGIWHTFTSSGLNPKISRLQDSHVSLFERRFISSKNLAQKYNHLINKTIKFLKKGS